MPKAVALKSGPDAGADTAGLTGVPTCPFGWVDELAVASLGGENVKGALVVAVSAVAGGSVKLNVGFALPKAVCEDVTVELTAGLAVLAVDTIVVPTIVDGVEGVMDSAPKSREDDEVVLTVAVEATVVLGAVAPNLKPPKGEVVVGV